MQHRRLSLSCIISPPALKTDKTPHNWDENLNKYARWPQQIAEMYNRSLNSKLHIIPLNSLNHTLALKVRISNNFKGYSHINWSGRIYTYICYLSIYCINNLSVTRQELKSLFGRWNAAFYELYWPFKWISTSKRDWIGYNLSNTTTKSEIKFFCCRNNLSVMRQAL